MKKLYLFIAIIGLSFPSISVDAQTIIWTDTFTTGVPATAGQITTWNNFRAQLLGSYPYSKMTISGTFDPVGKVCTDPTIILAYANALRTLADYTSPLTNGNVWSLCGTRYQGEVWLNPPTQCSGANCPTGYIIRPGIGTSNQNWGGVNTATCSGPTQTMTFIFEACAGEPSAAITPFTQDTVCLNDAQINLPPATPINGTYSGAGVSGSTFDPSLAGVGSHYVVYSYTDSCNIITADSTLIVVNALPVIAIPSFNPDTVCLNSPAITLPVSTPSGGTYSGLGVSGSTFTPSTAGVGTHYVAYTYTDTNSCTNSDSTMIVVNACVGINEETALNGVSIYPNPTSGLVSVDLGKTTGAVNYSISTVEGRIVQQLNDVTTNTIAIDLSNESKGIYFLKIKDATSTKSYKVIKE